MKISHNRKLHILPSIFAIPIIAIFLLTFSVNVYAASAQTYFPCVQLENNKIPEVVITGVRSSFSSYDHYFIYGPVNSDPTFPDYFFVCWSGGSVYGTIPSGYPFYFDLGRSNNSSFVSGLYGYYNGSSFLRSQNYSNFYMSQHYYSNVYSPSIDFAVDDDFYDNNGNVLVFAEPPLVVPDTGHAQDPANNIPTFSYPIGMHPTSAPTVPTYIAPTIPSLPSFDLDHPFESLFDILDWFANGVIDTLNSFIQIFIDWVEFLGNLIVWLFKSFIDFCTSFWNWLYRIFKFLFEPIYDFLSNFFKFLFNEEEQLSIYDLIKQFKDGVLTWTSAYWNNSWLNDFFTNLQGTYTYFATLFAKLLLFFDKVITLGTVNGEFSILNLVKALFVPSGSQVVAMMKANDEYGFYDLGHALYSTGDEIRGDISRITPTKTFHIPGTTWHGVTVGDFNISFDWYDDYKDYGDGIISVFLIFGWIYWLWLNLSHLMRGSASVGPDIERVNK